MIEFSLIKKSYFSNKNDGTNLTDIVRSVNSSEEILLNVAQMKQTHSSHIEQIETEGIYFSDGIITSKKNVSLVVQTADCMPVLIETDKCIAALHIGWKGLQNNIFDLAIQKLIGQNISVSIGPHAQSCCYEVKKDVAKIFPNETIHRKGKLYLILSNKIIEYCKLNNIKFQVSDICTICNNEFWSYRENKTSERQYSLIWI